MDVVGDGAGPGCSSIAYGFGEELGPFFINPGGQTLRLNPNAGNRRMCYNFFNSSWENRPMKVSLQVCKDTVLNVENRLISTMMGWK